VPPEAATVARALALLGKRNLVLSLLDSSFPCAPGEDTGRGSPYTRGGREFLELVAGLGFTGVQLGPQGMTTAGNPSPYDATLFARDPLSIDPFALAADPQWAGILAPDACARLVADAAPGPRVHHRRVHAAYAALLDAAAAGLAARRAALAAGALPPADAAAVRGLLAGLAEFAATHRAWLVPSALYTVLAARHGDDWRRWPDPVDRHLLRPEPGESDRCAARRDELLRAHAPALAAFELQQYIVHRQHAALRVHARRLGLKLLGDLQVGVALPDLWAHRDLFLADYRIGAPPSRTNPAGQPWNYPVLDPTLQRAADGRPGPVLAFMRARVDKLLGEFDGLRIDHPHGLVCPWVYRADDDPHRAVQSGARLFAAPDLPDHPALARHAIPRRDQLSPDPTTPRHADDWVRDLDPDQVDRYAARFDVLLAAAAAHGRDRHDLLCEVLSTLPYPLRRVLQRHGLGRFRVTQKADLTDPADVYRAETAAPEDWIMVGNHDTPTLWELVDRWHGTDVARAQARHLAERLAPDGADVAALARDLAADPRRLAHAKFAELLASPAENVLVFFADLLGLRDRYNLPGTVDDANWSLRIAPDHAARYAADRRARAALDLPAALAMALRRRGQPHTAARAELLAALGA
jgi:4-alpha-glucanotransferase